MFHVLYGSSNAVATQLNVLTKHWAVVRVVYLEHKPDKVGMFEGIAETAEPRGGINNGN